MLLLVAVADTQGLRHPGEDLVVEAQAIEQFGEPFLQHLLPGVRLRAFPFGPAAVIVDVAALLDLGDHRTATVPAAHQAGEGEVALRLLVAVHIAAAEQGLRFVPQLTADDRLVRAVVALTLPIEVTHVDRIAQHLVHAALGHRVAAVAKRQPVLTGLAGDVPDGILPRHVPLEHLPDHGHQFRVRLDGLLAVLAEHVAVTERRIGRPDPLLGLLGHALAGLFRKVVDVVLRHQHLDAMHELLGGSGIGGEDDVLLGEVDLQFQLVQGHPVLQVAVKAVGLLDQDDAGLRMLAKIVHHLAEAGAAGLLGGLHVDVLLDDVEAFGQGVVAQQLELGRD
ncbi:MAG: hypothetical protein QF705_04775 [Arenicellales bacterium]|nr:hypothetical protein [Arenicellales bacterium]MDP7482058.1 hypothetical protein [Arenicellales bacterium]